MAKVNAYSQIQPFEYTPIGLEAFATPLAKMQTNIDTARDTLEDTSFNISAMSVDDTRSKQLTKDFEGARDELLDNLMKTNNYRQAVSKIKKLNKYYTGNEEITALSSNKKAFDEAKAKSEAQVKANEISEQEHQEWLFRTLGMFNEPDEYGRRGTAYDPSTGRYRSVNTELRTKNLEKEIMDLSVKLASSAPAQQDVLLSEWAEGVDPTQLESLKATIKAKILTAGKIGTIPHEGIASELKKALATSKRYKDFLNQEAKYKYYWDKYHRGNPEEFDNEIINGAVKSLAGLEEETKEQINTATDPNIQNQLKENLELITTQRNSINNQINTGDIASMAESIFTSDYYDDKIGDWGYDIGNVYDFIENQQVRESREIPGMKDKIKKLDDLPKIHTSNQQAKGSADERYSITGGYGPSNKAHRNIFNGKTMTQWFDTPFETTIIDNKTVQIGELFDEGQTYLNTAKNNQGVSISAVEKDLQKLEHNTQALTAIQQEFIRVSNSIRAKKQEKDEALENYNNLSNVDKKGDKGRYYKSIYNKATQELEQDLKADETSGELYYIENKMKEFASKNSEFAKFYNKINDPLAVINKLIKTNVEKEKTFNSEINELQNSEEWQNPGGQDMFYPGINYDSETGEVIEEGDESRLDNSRVSRGLMFNVEKYGNPRTWDSKKLGRQEYSRRVSEYNNNLDKVHQFMREEMGVNRKDGYLKINKRWNNKYRKTEAIFDPNNSDHWHYSVIGADVFNSSAEDIKTRKDTGPGVQKYIDEEADLKAMFPELMQEIHKDLNKKRNLTANEIILTEDADEWTNGEFEKLITQIDNNPANTATGYQLYDFDAGSKVAKVNSNIKTIEGDAVGGHAPELYSELEPTWEGVANIVTSKGEREGQVLRRKRKGDNVTFTNIVEKRHNASVGKDEDQWDELTPTVRASILKRFEENNPTDIHTAVVGTSFNMDLEARRSYEENLEAAALIGDIGKLNQIVQNTVPIHVLSNMDRAKEYNQAVSKLQSAIENGTKEKIISPPNYWDIDATNGTTSGNKITYFYDDKVPGAIIMKVEQYVYEYKNGIMGDFIKIIEMPQQILSGFDAITLAANDIKFGTGDERDILYSANDGSKQIIPPAFRVGNAPINNNLNLK